MTTIPGASIRGQCSRRDFYAFAPDLEHVISELEAETAAVIREVSASRLVPEPEAPQRHVLLDFIALQKLRTAASGGRNDVQTDYFAKVWAQSDPELSAIDPQHYRIVNRYPVALPLLQFPHVSQIVSDLELHLFANGSATSVL